MLQSPRLLYCIPVDDGTVRQCHREQLVGSLVGVCATSHGLVVGLGVVGHLSVEGIEVYLPPIIIEVLQQPLPFLVGIVAQSALVGTHSVAPCRYLHPCVPFVQVFLLWCRSQRPCHLRPVAEAEFPPCAQQLVLHEEHPQEAFCIPFEVLACKCVVVGNGLQVLPAALVGESLPGYVHQVVQVVVVVSHPVRCRQHLLSSLAGVFRVVVVSHLRPALHLEIVQSRPAAEDALVRPLLVVAKRTVVYGGGEQHPCLFDILVVFAIPCHDIFPHPFLLCRHLAEPWQLAHKLEHHGVVLRSLHCEACSSHGLCPVTTVSCQAVVAEQLVHAPVQSHIAAEVLQHAEHPRVSLVSFVAFPYRWYAEHGTALREEVEYHDISVSEVGHHLRAWVLRPSLHHPFRLVVGALHGLHHRLSGLGVVCCRIIVALVERVHGVVF